MTNSTQNDHETHIACIRRIQKEGASATCCYCNPHEDCTLHSKEIDEMEKAIDEGFVESEKAIKGMKTPFDKTPNTHRDWKERKSFTFLEFGFEKGLISHDGACYIKKDNISFYGQNIDPKELDSKIKTLEKLKLIKKEYELFFGKI